MKQYDPKMHSTEHILNQTMVRMFNCGRSFSAHIEKKKSKVDYHFERDINSSEVDKIETKVNEVIKSGLEVREDFFNKEEAIKKFNLDKLPEDAGEEIRIIHIGDYDSCPCIGNHVKNTNEIGEFKIISTNYDSGILRIRFRLI
ncbi:MAG: hypothetical protein COW08_08475 [Ignavibacteriales bacterium CG12_big_fil_rev_8_21_14_0_65_30_8]|nr:MAG: hypothetical protein COW08_08475 [Ignavibacteriales bacterium CG12_big_fil_rev_8_21_14_0_65_30_8]